MIHCVHHQWEIDRWLDDTFRHPGLVLFTINACQECHIELTNVLFDQEEGLPVPTVTSTLGLPDLQLHFKTNFWMTGD